MRTGRSLSWVIALAGVWEIISPFILGFSAVSVATWNSIIIGIVLVVLGAWAALSANTFADRTLDWINAVLGLWLVLSPFILRFSATTITAMWSDIIAGIVVIILGLWAAFSLNMPINRQV